MIFPPLAASFHSHLATAAQRIGKVTVQLAAACFRFPRGSALKSAFSMCVGKVARWQGDFRELPLLAADFRFAAISSPLWDGHWSRVACVFDYQPGICAGHEDFVHAALVISFSGFALRAARSAWTVARASGLSR